MEYVIKPLLGVALLPVLFLGLQMLRGKAGRGNLTSAHGLTVLRSAIVAALVPCIVWYLAGDTPESLRINAPPWLRLVGILLFVAGAALRFWAQRTLGRYWSADISTRADHALIEDGPYYWFRHPIYSSYWPLALGLLLATSHVLIGSLALVFATVSFLRIPTEEAMLSQHFGDSYREYTEVRRMRVAQTVIAVVTLNSLAGAVWEIGWAFQLI